MVSGTEAAYPWTDNNIPCRRYGWWCVTDVRYQVRMYYNWKEVQLLNNVVSDPTTESISV